MFGKSACIGKAAGNRWRDPIQTSVFTKRFHVCQPLWVQPSHRGSSEQSGKGVRRMRSIAGVEIRVAAPWCGLPSDGHVGPMLHHSAGYPWKCTWPSAKRRAPISDDKKKHQGSRQDASRGQDLSTGYQYAFTTRCAQAPLNTRLRVQSSRY